MTSGLDRSPVADDLLPSDGELVAEILAGQVDRFGALVGRYEGALRRVAVSRLGRHDWAEEVVQETFLALFRGLSTYDSRFSFRTWLWTILLNQCRRRQGYEGREPRVWSWSEQTPANDSSISPIEESHCPQPEPIAALLANERAEQLQRLLETLPESQADALRLRFFGELKFQEIAEALGCSLLTAKNRVKAGLLKLAAVLSKTNPLPDGGQAKTLTLRKPSAPASSGGSER